MCVQIWGEKSTYDPPNFQAKKGKLTFYLLGLIDVYFSIQTLLSIYYLFLVSSLPFPFSFLFLQFPSLACLPLFPLLFSFPFPLFLFPIHSVGRGAAPQYSHGQGGYPTFFRSLGSQIYKLASNCDPLLFQQHTFYYPWHHRYTFPL